MAEARLSVSNRLNSTYMAHITMLASDELMAASRQGDHAADATSNATTAVYAMSIADHCLHGKAPSMSNPAVAIAKVAV